MNYNNSISNSIFDHVCLFVKYSRFRCQVHFSRLHMLVFLIYNSCFFQNIMNLTRFNSRFRWLFEDIVLKITREKRMIFSWKVESRRENIDFLAKNKKICCSDFDIRDVWDLNKKTDYSCKYLNVDMSEKEKHLIEANILSNSDFDENFEIDLLVIWIDFVIEIESFLVKCSTWRRADSEIFWSMWKMLIGKCLLENVN